MRIVPILLLVSLSAAAHGADRRTSLALENAQREVVLTEMRLLLQAVSQIISALGRGDFRSVTERAQGVGMEMVGKSEGDRRLMKSLPPEFLNLGLSVHRDFDMLAAAAGASATRDDLLRRLGDITGRCGACHDTYRIDSPCVGSPPAPESDYRRGKTLLSCAPR